MKNLENQQAIITLDKNILIIKTEKEEFEFVANQDNFIVIQNKGLLW